MLGDGRALTPVIPMATPTPSVGEYIAQCQRVLESLRPQGLRYEVRSRSGPVALTSRCSMYGACGGPAADLLSGYGTNLEGPFSLVWRALGMCHEAVHAMGVPRIATDVRLGTRTDKPATEKWADGLGENERKRESVRRRVAADGGEEAGAPAAK